jgi:pimeloyl-ACP methyl ester carboxylesterase
VGRDGQVDRSSPVGGSPHARELPPAGRFASGPTPACVCAAVVCVPRHADRDRVVGEIGSVGSSGRRGAVIIPPVQGIDAWWSAGKRVEVGLGGTARQIFLRRAGAGPTMTLLHGFPSSSHDWAAVLPALAERNSLVLFDFLGFGASQIGAQITQELWIEGLKPTFAAGFDAAAAGADIWRATAREDGQLVVHRVIRYMNDRALHAARWVAALEQTDVPLAFVWGMLDPISGAHMAARIRARLPAAPFTALADVGHWPALEAPARVVAALRAGARARD